MRDEFVLQGVDRLDTALAVLDSEGTVVYANEVWTHSEVSGTVPAATAVGEAVLPACETIAADATAATARERIETLLTGDTERAEIEYDRPQEDALPRRFRLQGRQFTHEDDTYVVVEHTERTAEHRTAQERDHYRETLADVATVVSHDIRSPLTAALSWAELLGADPETDTEKLDRVVSGVERTNAIADTAVELARETTVEEIRPVAVGAAAARVWDHIDTGDAELVVEEGDPVLADERSLEVLLKNLLRNAVQHGTPEEDASEQADLTVRVGPLADGFYVEDDGTGIEDGVQNNLFEVGVTTGAGDGDTGIGLAIVERAAEAHGWTADTADGETDGARFEIAGVDRP